MAESVVVIKKLLQTQPTEHSEIIKHMAKLFDNITVRVILSLMMPFTPKLDIPILLCAQFYFAPIRQSGRKPWTQDRKFIWKKKQCFNIFSSLDSDALHTSLGIDMIGYELHTDAFDGWG